ncbi:glycosyltransferase family 2 protein [Yokenella regensburgei]|uniref:glycosyltransferase family 2 protein n=1 Tax=Yokenella regensburgei TaxID=158877 RepID=UPI003ED8BA71
MKISLIIPTYNGGQLFEACLKAIKAQSRQPDQIFIIDSSSSDQTREIAEKHSCSVHVIDARDFNHGGTRNLAVSLADESDILIFLTQDAILYNEDSISRMVDFFSSDGNIAAVCGRQIPHDDANPLASHARYYNYPAIDSVKTKVDINSNGIKVAFMSNSFAGYRTRLFKEFGGFPEDNILAEDMYICAKFVLAGYKIGYSAHSVVKHSHNYTPLQEFKRYFDTGVFHSNEPWIREAFGSMSGEGLKFILSEWKYLVKKSVIWLPVSFLFIGLKLLGFKMGTYWRKIPASVTPKLSMYKSYWNNKL